MRLSRILIRNFRSLRDIDVPTEDYSTLIGPNGAGKSSVLYAVEWFFGMRSITSRDRYYDTDEDLITVTLVFDQLSELQRERFGEFALDDTLRLSKQFDTSLNRDRYIGTIRTKPEFEEALGHSRIADNRNAYSSLREIHPTLPLLVNNFSKEDMKLSFRQFLALPENHQYGTIVNDADATALFKEGGAFGNSCKLVFIPGGQDMAGELVSTTKSSILGELTNSLIEPARLKVLNEWKEKNRQSLDALTEHTQETIQTAVEEREATINASLSRYDKRASIVLEPTSPEIEVRYPVSIATRVRIGDSELQYVQDQGHGTQRAVLMAMIETLQAQTELEGESEDVLILLVAEEPEVYQHPVRARSFARTLVTLSKQPGYQVLIATHSPSFVATDFLNSLRIMRLNGSESQIWSASIKDVADARNKSFDEIRNWMDRELPRGVSEAFFSELVVLVEGETDYAILSELSNLIGVGFDHLGIICLHIGGKQDIPVFKTVLDSLGLKSFVVFDGDYCDDIPDCDAKHKATKRRQTEELISRLGLLGSGGMPEYEYGQESAIVSNTCIYHRDLEDELSKWKTYMDSLRIVNPNGSVKNAHKYRRAVKDSSFEDMPRFLRELLDSIHVAAL